MKRILLALPLFLVLSACHITINNDDGTTREVDVQGIAFKVFQQIPQDDYDTHFRDQEITCPDNCTTHFELSFEYSPFNEPGFETLQVDCLPMDDGGWLALLTGYGCADYCSYNKGKAYVYKDGVLTEAPDKLPTPLYEGEELAKEVYKRSYYNGKLSVMVVGLETDEWGEPFTSQETTYVWNGHQFEEVDNQVFPFDAEEEEVAEADTCDMEALYEALCNDDERFRDFESTIEYADNALRGTTFSNMDLYYATLNVSCKPLSDGGFRVVVVVNSMEDGEEESYTTTYIYKDGVLYEYDDGE